MRFFEIKTCGKHGEKVENTSKSVKRRVENRPETALLNENFEPVLNESM
jgi:hypothetical protein